MQKSAASLLVASLLSFACLPGYAQGDSHSIRFEEIQVIGNDLDEPVEALFTHPAFALRDGKGNMYVADRGVHEIKVFDSAGSFVRTFGSHGDAPGEFQSFTGLAISPEDELLVFDGRKQRITYVESGEMQFRTARIATRTNLAISREGSNYFVASNDWYAADARPFITAYAPGLAEWSAVTTGAEFIPQHDDILVQALYQQSPGSVAALTRDSIIYAPTLYDGRIYLYSRSADGDLWKRRMIRDRKYREPFTRLPSSAESADIVTRFKGSDRKGMIHGESRGIFVLDGGWIVHFAVLEANQTVALVAEVFTRGGEHFATSELIQKDFQANAAQTIKWQLTWGSEDGVFLAIDREEVPVVRVLRLVME